ncbi:hypothetical protein OG453_07650 [Streptomyces sp. NBC_01381]|uniref:hypothetical protein n=1 Tax=Streptomyces sp. NBC_01381 TaxID=2903845 RepID=UPI00224EC034|nr:hypothetical protein [Streptomyces sp. NBC_01381]MCX4666544.1 hypothetical protein [Streptomyces sp. NBC_01381]
MSDHFIEINHVDDYAARFGETWRGRQGLESITAAYPSIVVDGWSQEGWVYFLPGGQDGPLDEVGRIIVVGASGSMPVRVCRDSVTRAEWNAIQAPFTYGQEIDFDRFMHLVHGQ